MQFYMSIYMSIYCRGLECITEVSSQRRRFCACSVNVPADQFLDAESAAGLVNKESQDLFLFLKRVFHDSHVILDECFAISACACLS